MREVAGSCLILSVMFWYRTNYDSSALCAVAVAGIIGQLLKTRVLPNPYQFLGQYVILNIVVYCFGVHHMYDDNPVLAALALCLLLFTMWGELLSQRTKRLLPLADAAPGVVCFVVIWVSSAFYLLDWNEEWQIWPTPTILGAVAGSVFSTVIRGVLCFAISAK
jgi:hypothetical protein